MDHCPENTLCGLQAVIDAGASLLKFDIQLIRDRIPVVLHDDTLEGAAEPGQASLLRV